MKEGFHTNYVYDLFTITKEVSKQNKSCQAKFLQELEEVIDDKETYLKVRKIFLDNINNFARSIIKSIFGTDLEGTLK